jgi:glutathione S-transferase
MTLRVPPMSTSPEITLHILPPSHPSWAAQRALELKGLEFERVEMTTGEHNEQMEAIYGEGNKTVPGMVIDGDAVHGSSAIFARLEEASPEYPLFPEPIADKVREADRWGDEQLQDLGRSLGWGALHFRPEALGTFAGGEPLDPAGTGYAIKYVRATWRYHGITTEQLAEHLAGLPAMLDHIDELAAEGVMGGENATAADLQIGSTIRVLMTIGDLMPLIENRSGAEIAMRWFPEYPGHIPAGAFPAGWVPGP